MATGTKITTSNEQHIQQISEQRIRFLELLQLSNEGLEARIAREMEENPALEEAAPEETELDNEPSPEELAPWTPAAATQQQGSLRGTTPDARLPSNESLQEQLLRQLSYLSLTETERRFGQQLIGSLEADGYLRRSLISIANDLHRVGEHSATPEALEAVLGKIHTFEPAGIGARNLRECLRLQLAAQSPKNTAMQHAESILKDHYKAFTKKHYAQIAKRLRLSKTDLEKALSVIVHLNPKPGGSSPNIDDHNPAMHTPPDFILQLDEDDIPKVLLRKRLGKPFGLNPSYIDLLRKLQQRRTKTAQKDAIQTRQFLQQRLESAKRFIEALRQRDQTLLRTAEVIVLRQADFLRTGDPVQLRPMGLRNIAEVVNVDVSTVSRIVNNKRIETPWGIMNLRDFFSQTSTTNAQAEPVSGHAIKALLKRAIEGEDKQQPLSDEALREQLGAAGYQVARRTIAKYREQLAIPVARLRKQW